jgi:tetratricopeptide (TPR) repeat protein
MQTGFVLGLKTLFRDTPYFGGCNKMQRIMIKSLIVWLGCFVLITTLAGCGSVESRRQKYFERGKSYVAEEKYKEAEIEFKNALQIDPEFAEGYFELVPIRKL